MLRKMMRKVIKISFGRYFDIGWDMRCNCSKPQWQVTCEIRRNNKDIEKIIIQTHYITISMSHANMGPY